MRLLPSKVKCKCEIAGRGRNRQRKKCAVDNSTPPCSPRLFTSPQTDALFVTIDHDRGRDEGGGQGVMSGAGAPRYHGDEIDEHQVSTRGEHARLFISSSTWSLLAGGACSGRVTHCHKAVKIMN